MKKKIVFIKLSIDSGYPSDFNHGIACLVPVARKHSYEVDYLSFCEKVSREELRNKIIALDPSIVAFSCTSHQLKYLAEYSNELEKCPNILQIAGGVGMTLYPDWVFSQSAVKGVCVGEGEIPLDELLSNIENDRDIEGANGFYWHLNGQKIRNPIPQFVPDLSVLDFPDYSIFDRKTVIRGGEITVMFGRGCPYSCYYCGNAALRSVYPSTKGYWRIPAVEYCIKLLEKTLKQYPGIKSIVFADDLLVANKTWFKEFADEYSKRIKVPYKLCGRSECITDELIKTLKQSGCEQVSMGVESGNEHFRKTVLNRKHSNKEIIEKCRMISDAGLCLYTFTIVGFPFEDKEKMKDTYNLVKEIKPCDGHCSFFFPYPRTELYRMCKEADLLRSADEMTEMTNFYDGPAIKMTPEQEKDCICMRNKILAYYAANRKRYKRRKKTAEATAHMGKGIRKSFWVACYSSVGFLLDIPWLHKTLRCIYRLSGIRAIKRKIMKVEL